MQRSNRKAAATARSQITTSARLVLDHESESEFITEPARKTARFSAKPRQIASESPEWYIAIDFGTTYTTVAWHKRGTHTERIYTIDNFPGEKEHHETHRQIPTEVWYPKRNARPFGNVKARDIRMRFGNEVHRMAEDNGGLELREVYDDNDRVTMMKLLLDKTNYAQVSKEKLHETLESLKSKGCIEENHDVFHHFFREVFRATKARLSPDFNDDSTVEVTFCVPVCYNPAAVAILGAQVERAMRDVRFGTDGKSPCNIFVVHEAEAQAMHALTNAMYELESFVLIDCGGGTTDVGIYRIALTDPLRLEAEVHEAMGAMVGAGDLNNQFRTLVKGILCKETYLEQSGDTLDTIVAAEVIFKFENDIKRAFRYNDTETTYPIRIRGLKQSWRDDRICDNYLVLTYQDIWSIFGPSVKKIGGMMADAVLNAKKAGYIISKIVVVGGFGDSPCLREYFTEQKNRMVKKLGIPLKLRFSAPNTSATGVATGAILRSINKADGPSRIPCQSIGVLHHIPCDPENEHYTPEILNQPKTWIYQEGLDYIMNTIRWIVKKDDNMLESVHTVTFESEHLFEPHQKEWVIEEQLWASETCTLDFYQLDHPKNSGRTMEIGAVEFDISKMRQKIRTANIRADEMADKVVILVEMTVIDRNLEFTARWPATPDGQIIQGSRRFFSIASAFTPGTQ
ncbi:hypothetical protein ST47_g2822 [Ascochyta rabiei]|uniref:ATP binding n=1 Tax=Didymella rabiei TaxID=5454 RepID=A0A163IYC5_DIDRA|nr:hypothetical protein ST47_g2822 [Ascochyta rabiei]